MSVLENHASYIFRQVSPQNLHLAYTCGRPLRDRKGCLSESASRMATLRFLVAVSSTDSRRRTAVIRQIPVSNYGYRGEQRYYAFPRLCGCLASSAPTALESFSIVQPTALRALTSIRSHILWFPVKPPLRTSTCPIEQSWKKANLDKSG
jgi:hypothetical protein